MLNRVRPLVLLASATALAVCVSAQTTVQAKTADRIVIFKSAHSMKLMHGREILRTYQVALSTVPAGAKERLGDHKVPEGDYVIDRKNPQSKFHLALHVSYPNATDRTRAHKLGVEPGGDIEIHGLPKSYARLGALHRQTDWTDGCVAVTNAEIEEIYPMVPVGTTVEIHP
jgi:murein L,D-transpeptidase YafK